MKKSLATRALFAGFFSLASVFASAAGASSGSLDGSFGDNGVVTAAVGGSATAEAVAVEPDGDLVTAGFAVIDGVYRLAVTRHDADGSLDRRFGTNGVVTTGVGMYPVAQAVVVQDDGKIVVAGKALADRSNSELVLVRYRADGSLDRGFGENGVVETRTGTFAVNAVAGIALTPEGKLVVAANVGPGGVNHFGVLRFNPDGSRDETFGTDGMVVTEMTAFAAAASVANCSAAIPGGLVLQPDGKVVVAGSIQLDGLATRVALVRYNVDGSPDELFAPNGILITVLGSTTGAAIARQSDGSLLVGGTARSGGAGFGLARYRADGSLDTTFGAGGTVQAPFTSYDATPSGLLVEPDGSIVMDGSATLGPNSRGIALARFHPDGMPDSTFGTNGVTTTATGPLWVPTGLNSGHYTLICPFRCVSPVVRQASGRLVVADGARNENDERTTFRLVGYADAPSSPDPGPPSHDASTTTTIAEGSSTKAATPPQDELPSSEAPSTTATTAAPKETAITLPPGPGSTRPPRFPVPAETPATGGIAAPSTSFPTSPMTSESLPSPAESNERAVAATSEGDRPAWPLAALLAAGVVSGSAAVARRRRASRSRS